MSIFEAWAFGSLIDVSLKAMLLVVLAWAGLAMLRTRSASAQHFAWLLVLVGMILLPVLVYVAPTISAPGWLYPTIQASNPDAAPLSTERAPMTTVSNPTAIVTNQPIAAPRSTESATTSNMHESPLQKTIEPQRVAKSSTQTSPSAASESPSITTSPSATTSQSVISTLVFGVICVYAAGVVVMLGRLLIGVVQMTRLLRHARPIDLSAAKTWLPSWARIAESREVRVPVTLGYWRPVVVIPEDWRDWSESFMKTVLAHEAAHILRRDTWVMLLSACNCALYWFHPAAWIVRRQLIDLAEQVCDDAVIRATRNRTDYARNLIEIAGRLATGRGRLQLEGVAMARRPHIEQRIEAIMDSDRPLSARLKTITALLLISAFIPLVLIAAGLHPANSAVAAEPTPKSGTTQTAQAHFAGRVVMAEDHKPVANAVVRLRTTNGDQFNAATTRTNDQGEFILKGPLAGKHRLAAFFEDYSSRTKMFDGLEAKPDGTSVVLELKKAPSLQIKVVKRADHKPIEDAIVRVNCTDYERDHKTDANGEAILRALTPEPWTAKVLAPGCAEHEFTVNLNGTERANVTAELDPGVELFGVVRDDEGHALSNVGINAYPADFHGGQLDYLKTDSEGRFRFPYMPIAGLKLILSKDGYVDARPDVAITATPGGQQELNLTLPRRPDGGSVRGVVVDSKGAPIAGATLRNSGMASNKFRSATTDAAGQFLLEDVYEGSMGHELLIKANKFAPLRMTFTPGKKNHPTEISIVLENGHSIQGKVVDEQGAPLADVVIYYAHGNRGDGMAFGGTTTTDKQGRFEFNSLPADTPFDFAKEGYSAISDKKLPLDGTDEVAVTLQSEGMLRGRVVDDSTGKPITPFTVQITFSPDRKSDDPSDSLSGARAFAGEQFSNPSGTFELRGLGQGMPFQLTVSATGFERKVLRRVIAEAKQKAEPTEFRLTRVDQAALQKVAGRILDAQSRPVAGAELRLIVATKRSFPRDRFPFNWEMIRSGQVGANDVVQQFLATTSDANGKFAFDGVRAANDIELAYWGEGAPQDRLAKLEQLTPEKLADITIQAKPASTIRGSIDRKTFPEVTDIELNQGLTFQRAIIAPDKSSYEVRNLASGEYELQVYARALRDASGADGARVSVLKRLPVSVKPGENATLDIRPDADATSPAEKDGEAPAQTKPPQVATTPPANTLQPIIDEHSDIVITGVVRDAAGHTINGAKLWLPLKYEDERFTATSNDQGKFSFQIPAADAQPVSSAFEWTIWCYTPNHQIATASAYKQLRRQTVEPIALALGPETDTGFVVNDDAGKRMAGALVEPWHVLAASYEIVPEPLRKILAQKTDANGRALLPTMNREGFMTVQVTADGYGAQQQRLRDKAREPAIRTINLRPTGRIEGQFVSDNKAVFHNARVFVNQEDFDGEHTRGQVSLAIDGDGRFAVPAFAEGPIELLANSDLNIPLRPRFPEKMEVVAGKTTRLRIPFEPTVRVQGRVQTKEGGKAVAGATVSVQYGTFHQLETVSTDADGRFAANVLSGDVSQNVFMLPEKGSHYTEEQAGWQHHVQVPARAKTFDLPPIELVETFEQTGRLVDRNDRPVAAVRFWAIKDNRVYAGAMTDEQGAFSLWLPKAPVMETYQVYRENGSFPLTAKVVQESPLALKLTE